MPTIAVDREQLINAVLGIPPNELEDFFVDLIRIAPTYNISIDRVLRDSLFKSTDSRSGGRDRLINDPVNSTFGSLSLPLEAGIEIAESKELEYDL